MDDDVEVRGLAAEQRARVLIDAQPEAAGWSVQDGTRLAELMLRHGVGVQAETTVTVEQLDEDFFESL